jgi:hypothetical protein
MLACAEQLLLELGQLPQTWLECCLGLFLGESRVGLRIVLSETDAHPSWYFETKVIRHVPIS